MEPIVVNNEKEFLEAVKNAPPESTIVFNDQTSDEDQLEGIKKRNEAKIVELIEKLKKRRGIL